MTLPDEELRALKETRKFLRMLLYPKETPRVPKAVRTQAAWKLRHFPPDYVLDDLWRERLKSK